MVHIFDNITKQLPREIKAFVKLSKVIFFMLLFAHFAACCWWFVGQHTNHNTSWIDEIKGDITNDFAGYSYAFYWAIVTLFTTGYGDIVATNTTEQWVSSVCIIIGTIFFSYFIGTLTVLITDGDKYRAYESGKLEEAQSFCEMKKLPKELTRAILTHIRYHCQYNYVFNENDLLQSLPPYLQSDIHKYLAHRILSQIDMFKSLNKSILGQIALKMRSISCNEDYELFKVGDRAKAIYIQRTGVSTMRFYDKRNKKLIQLKRGNVFGEYSFLSPKRKVSVECNTWAEFYILKINDILTVLKNEYPSTWLNKWKTIRNLVIKNNYITNKKFKIRKITYQNHQKILSDHNLHHQVMMPTVDIDPMAMADDEIKDNSNENVLHLNNKLSTFLHGASTVKTARFHGRKSVQTEWDGSIPSTIPENKAQDEITASEILSGQKSKTTTMRVINEEGTFQDDDVEIHSTDLVELQRSQSEPQSSVGIFEKTFFFKQNSSIRHRTMSSAHKKKMSSLTMNDIKHDTSDEQFELFSPNAYNIKDLLYYPGSNTMIVDSDDDAGDIGLGLENIASAAADASVEQNIVRTPSQYSRVIDNLDLAHAKYVKSTKEQNQKLAQRTGHLNNENCNHQIDVSQADELALTKESMSTPKNESVKIHYSD